MFILKFGGTSVGKPERLRKVGDIVLRTPGKKVVVLSALSGTTNTLVKIGDYLLGGHLAEAGNEIVKLEQRYKEYAGALFTSTEFQAIGMEIVGRYFIEIRRLAEGRFDDRAYRELLAQGELASTEFFFNHLRERQVGCRLLPALEFMSIDESQEPELEEINKKLTAFLSSAEQPEIYITQGYICRNHRNEIDNLKRGGSDYTASLIGAALRAKEVQIWTDIDGMQNNDPRVVKNTLPIAELTFDEASELAYFGAKILHPSTIVPAQKRGVPVRLKNTMDETAPGTLISNQGTSRQVKAVAAKDGIIAINIKSSRMLLAYGFLRQVFEVFERHRTPIDMISTSEVAVSLTIDDDRHLNSIVSDLQVFGVITVDHDQSIICVVGNKLAERQGVLNEVFRSLADVPVRMVSFGGSLNNISILVDKRHKEQSLRLLNKGLFKLEG